MFAFGKWKCVLTAPCPREGGRPEIPRVKHELCRAGMGAMLDEGMEEVAALREHLRAVGVVRSTRA